VIRAQDRRFSCSWASMRPECLSDTGGIGRVAYSCSRLEAWSCSRAVDYTYSCNVGTWCRTHPSALLHNEAARKGIRRATAQCRSEAPDTKHRGCACVRTHNEQGRARAEHFPDWPTARSRAHNIACKRSWYEDTSERATDDRRGGRESFSRKHAFSLTSRVRTALASAGAGVSVCMLPLCL
jgi:hypothetical protein